MLKKIRDKSITHSIFKIQDNKSIRWGFYCNAFIEYTLARKAFLDYSDLFSSNDYKKMTKQYISILRTNMAEESSLLFWLNENWWNKKLSFK